MSSESLTELALTQLKPGGYQPRQSFDQSALAELADSIRQQGVIEPIIVRPMHEYYEIIAGERRWRAAGLAGLDRVPCVIRDYSDAQAAAVTLIENLQRQDLNPIETAEALARLADEFDYTHDNLAAVLGTSRASVSNLLRLLALDARVQQCLREYKLSLGHGKLLAGMTTLEQYPLAQQVLTHGWSVRKLESVIKARKASVADVNSHPDKTRLEKRVADRFNAEVKIDGDRQGGWVKVKFYDYDTLADILQKMGVQSDDL